MALRRGGLVRVRAGRVSRVAVWAATAGLLGALGAAQAAPAVASSAPANAKPLTTGAYGVKGVTTLTPRKIVVKDGTKAPYKPAAIALPAASSGSAVVTAPLSGSFAGPRVRAAGTPVWAQAVNSAAGEYRGPSQVAVTVGSQAQARGLGITGVVWSVAGVGAGTGTLRVGLDYTAFAQAYGANFGSRLHLYTLPACALSTPQVAACRVRTPLASTNDAKGQSVSGLLTLTGSTAAAGGSSIAGASDSAVLRTLGGATVRAAATPSSSVVLAALSGAGQDGAGAGNYAASTLAPSGSWTAGGSSGSFTYSYPVVTPSASTSLVPKIALSYDSGSVDGKTAMTQAQASWVGDGWSSPDNSIEQTFVPCSDSPEGTASPTSTGDMCYDGRVLSVSLDGSSTQIVYDSSTSTYKLAADTGATVSHVTGSNNGSLTYNTDYWVITERDGTKYYFGRNQLPGYASGNAATNSVDYEPVYSSHSGDPCYSSSGFTSSVCTMAYRWHLDYVTDTHGQAMAYYYAQATNYYGQDNGASNVKYIRDSYLDHIDYGFTTATGPYGTIPDKVAFTALTRCVASTCDTLSSSMSASTAASEYPDVPTDLLCASGATCTSYAPAFFSTVRLSTITTKQYAVSSSAYAAVDTYTLTQTFPATGDSTSGTLWLSSIARTGNDTTAGGSTTSITEPAVSFAGTDLPNRVDTTNFPGLYRWRISAITNEMGGVTSVTYGIPAACSTSATPSANTASCYPVYWTPSGYSAPVLDWFYKYAATKVQEADLTGGSTTKTTSYSYASPAWHYDDNEAVLAKYRTYGQFRGYQSVTAYTGDGANDAQTQSTISYYQGMDGDYLSSTSTRSVSLPDSQNGTHTDSNALAGEALESTAYLGAGGGVDHSSISSYWVSAATATRTRTGLPSLTANRTALAESWTRQRLTDGGTISWRYTETDDSYDATASDTNFGLLQYAYSHTVPANTAYDQCSAFTYATGNTSLNLIGLPSAGETDSVACSGFTEGSVASVPAGFNTLGAPSSVTRPDQVVSASQTFYDDATFSTTFPQSSAPTVGNVTMTRKAVGYSSGAFVWQTQNKKTYDTYGRVLTSTNGNGNATTTAYTLNTAALTTAQSVTNAKSQAASETLDPTRALVLTATDLNGVVTTSQYDALGRVTSVWLDSRYTATSPPAANYLYSYTVSNSAVSGTVVQKMNDGLGYTATATVLDSFGRTRQTQTQTPNAGRLITDTFYDSRGWVRKKYNAWDDPSTTPALTLVGATESKIPNEDSYTYDGLGRVVEDASEKLGTTVSTTYSVYNGDATTVIPPPGAVTKTTRTDPLGRTSEIDEYSAAPTLTVPSNTTTGIFTVTGGSTIATTYGYDGHGQQATTTDADGQSWTSLYDLLGQVTEKIDPTGGTSYLVYDADGNPTQTQDSRGKYVSYTYDALDRKTGQYASTTAAQVAGASGNQQAAWVYDNSNNAVTSMPFPLGHLTTETSYAGGNAYTKQDKGFNKFGESTGEIYTIGAGAGNLAGTYTYLHTYTTYTGLPLKDIYNSEANGALPAETVSHTYTSMLDLPQGIGSGIGGYAQTTTYDDYGRISQEEIGSATSGEAWLTDTYDIHTGELSEQDVTHGTATTITDTVDDTTYAYDPSGNITHQTENRLGSSTDSETQCYTYNALDELTTTWSATDACATSPTGTSHSQVGNTLGTNSAYWTSWSYNNEGDRLTQTQHSLTAAADTVTTSTYSTTQPHTLTATNTPGGANPATSYGYDTAGNTTSRTTSTYGAQSLTWDNAERLTTVTTTSASTGYVYDADGALLIQTTPTAITLYLQGEQLTYTTATAAYTGIRYYPLPGGGTAVRTNATTGYTLELTDQHGTADLSLDYTAHTPTWRQYDPYGNPRGTTVTWADNRTFLNKVTDTSTGLTDIGARWYDPTTGRFQTLDPVFEATDTLALNGYGYAGGNPITYSDPTGLCRYRDDDVCLDPGASAADDQSAQGNSPSGEDVGASGGSGDDSGSAGGILAGALGGVLAANTPNSAVPPAGTSQTILNMIGRQDFQNGLGVFADYFKANGGWSYSRFNAVISVVYVEMDVDGVSLQVPKLVVFASKGGLGRDLTNKLTDLGATIYQSTDALGEPGVSEGHSEFAAEAIRNDPARQVSELGGEIVRVEAAYSTNNICSAGCARALTNFIDNPDVALSEKTRGYAFGRIIDNAALSDWQSATGLREELSVRPISIMLEYGFIGGASDERR
jgi:RHS repeat-associated protein